MDGLILVIVAIAALAVLGALASTIGVDSRDTMRDDRRQDLAW